MISQVLFFQSQSSFNILRSLCPFHSFSSFLMQWERRSHNRLVNFNSFVYPFLLYFFEIPIHLAISMYVYLHLLIHIMERLTKGLAYMNMSVTSMFLFPFETYIVTIKSVGGLKTPNFQSSFSCFIFVALCFGSNFFGFYLFFYIYNVKLLYIIYLC